MEGETVTFHGKHQHVRGAKLLFPPQQQPRPPLYFGGSSDVAQELAAEQVDLYLTWGEPPAQVAEKIAQVREKAARPRPPASALASVCTSSSAKPTRRRGRRRTALISHLDDETIARAQAAFAQNRLRWPATHGGPAQRATRQAGNQPQPVGRRRVWRAAAPGTALVGDAATVAERINEYAALGIDSFIFSGYPHLEEAYRVGELLFPLLDVDGAVHPAAAKPASAGGSGRQRVYSA